MAHQLSLPILSVSILSRAQPSRQTSNSSLLVNPMADCISPLASTVKPLPQKNKHISAICITLQGQFKHQPSSTMNKRDQDSRLPQWLRNAGLDTFNLRRAKASKGTFVLGAAEPWSHGTLEVRDGSTDRWFAFSVFGRHYQWSSLFSTVKPNRRYRMNWEGEEKRKEKRGGNSCRG